MKASVGFAALFFAVAGLGLAGDPKDEQAKLQGAWKNETGGKKYELIFAKGAFTLNMNDGDQERVYKGTWKIDAAKKPKQIDMTVTEGEKFKGETARGIYELSGDVLKWCANKPGDGDRPAKFPDQEGEGDYLNLVLKRAKK